MNVTVLYSADIGEGSVVGSGTVVVKPLPPYSVAVGNPARIIRKRGEAKKTINGEKEQ
jgi:acetyltransferase-like isoleucine patch superfamily enzyme